MAVSATATFFFAYCVSIFDFLRYPIFLFHLRYHLHELFFALFDASGVDVSGNALSVHDRRIPSFPHVFADLMDRSCSLPSVLAPTRLKFLAWGLLRSCVGCLLCRALYAVIIACNARDRAHRSVDSVGCRSHSFVGSMRVHVERTSP